VGRSLLILLLAGASREELEDAVEARGDGYPSVYIVAPADVAPLDWLATDETRANEEAGVRALEAEWLLSGQAEIDGGQAGHNDPVLAVADALERFPADEIVVVGDADTDLLAELSALGPVVAPRGVRPSTRRSRLNASWRAFSSGRSEGTPWVAFVLSNLGFLLIAIAFTLLAMLIIWLAT